MKVKVLPPSFFHNIKTKVFPLSFKEYYPVSGLEKADALEEYLTYGGMPLAVLEKDEAEKRKYLKGLHKRVYIKDMFYPLRFFTT